MNDTTYRGKISFVNYEKHFATIEYKINGKAKSVNCKTNTPDSGKKPHHYKVGDEVSFELKLSDRGDKMTAFNIKYLHNTAIALLAQKAQIENRFSGYLKKVDDEYFVKEWESYIFFPLQLSPWEMPPADTAENAAITFRLLNLDRPNLIAAELFSHNYIPEYHKSIEFEESKKEISAEVYKISPHGVYVHFFGGKIRGKIKMTNEDSSNVKEGDKIPVVITYISPVKIVIEMAEKQINNAD